MWLYLKIWHCTSVEHRVYFSDPDPTGRVARSIFQTQTRWKFGLDQDPFYPFIKENLNPTQTRENRKFRPSRDPDKVKNGNFRPRAKSVSKKVYFSHQKHHFLNFLGYFLVFWTPPLGLALDPYPTRLADIEPGAGLAQTRPGPKKNWLRPGPMPDPKNLLIPRSVQIESGPNVQHCIVSVPDPPSGPGRVWGYSDPTWTG